MGANSFDLHRQHEATQLRPPRPASRQAATPGAQEEGIAQRSQSPGQRPAKRLRRPEISSPPTVIGAPAAASPRTLSAPVCGQCHLKAALISSGVRLRLLGGGASSGLPSAPSWGVVAATGCARSSSNVHTSENRFAAQAVSGLVRHDNASALATFDPGIAAALADLMRRGGKSPGAAWVRGSRHDRCAPDVVAVGGGQTVSGACYVYDIGWDVTRQPRVEVRLWLSKAGKTWKVVADTYHAFSRQTIDSGGVLTALRAAGFRNLVVYKRVAGSEATFVGTRGYSGEKVVEMPVSALRAPSVPAAKSRLANDQPLLHGSLTSAERSVVPRDFEFRRLTEVRVCNVVLTSYNARNDRALSARFHRAQSRLRAACY